MTSPGAGSFGVALWSISAGNQAKQHLRALLFIMMLFNLLEECIHTYAKCITAHARKLCPNDKGIA